MVPNALHFFMSVVLYWWPWLSLSAGWNVRKLFALYNSKYNFNRQLPLFKGLKSLKVLTNLKGLILSSFSFALAATVTLANVTAPSTPSSCSTWKTTNPKCVSKSKVPRGNTAAHNRRQQQHCRLDFTDVGNRKRSKIKVLEGGCSENIHFVPKNKRHFSSNTA